MTESILRWCLHNEIFLVGHGVRFNDMGSGKEFETCPPPGGLGPYGRFFEILAQEVVVETPGTLFGVEETGLTGVIQNQFTPLSAYAFMVMALK